MFWKNESLNANNTNNVNGKMFARLLTKVLKVEM